jgi:hypothetical protein
MPAVGILGLDLKVPGPNRLFETFTELVTTEAGRCVSSLFEQLASARRQHTPDVFYCRPPSSLLLATSYPATSLC